MSRMVSAKDTAVVLLRKAAVGMARHSAEIAEDVPLTHDQREFDREVVALVRAAADAIEDGTIVVDS